jgi:hypothetical protein
MPTGDEPERPELTLVPKEEQGPAKFGAKDIERFAERRSDREDRRSGIERRSMIRFEPGKPADRRILPDRRKANLGWRGRDL